MVEVYEASMKGERMRKIKLLGGTTLLLLIILALLASVIAKEHQSERTILTFIRDQKAFTQEISKSIFYTYRKNENSSAFLDKTIKKYLNHITHSEVEIPKKTEITALWNRFYADVHQFRNQQRVITGYNSVVTARLVNRIYHNSVLLIQAFDQLIAEQELLYKKRLRGYKIVGYLLFGILIMLLLYLFTQIHWVMAFIQKFSRTSKQILENSTIEGIEPIEVYGAEALLQEAKANHNLLVEKIDHAIIHAEQSMIQTTQSLEEVAIHIEDFMRLVSTMQEEESTMLFEKEDVVIDSLETLMSLRQKLKYLQEDLHQLRSQKSL
jgi:hypothetical protein